MFSVVADSPFILWRYLFLLIRIDAVGGDSLSFPVGLVPEIIRSVGKTDVATGISLINDDSVGPALHVLRMIFNGASGSSGNESQQQYLFHDFSPFEISAENRQRDLNPLTLPCDGISRWRQA